VFLRLQRESKVGVVFLCACLSCARLVVWREERE